MRSSCFTCRHEILNHVMIRHDIDFNKNFSTDMEYLFNLNLRHCILSQGKVGS